MKCEDTDKGCKVHEGRAWCENTATCCLLRVDMDDTTGTLMCGECASDALESGVFEVSIKAWIRRTSKK